MPAITAPAAARESAPAAEPRTPPRRVPAPAADLPGSTDRRPGSPSDDEILGLDCRNAGALPANSVDDNAHENRPLEAGATNPESLRAALDANPDLRRAWDDAQAYRETFATPDDARAATARLADLDRLDALFFSRRAEDHAELARAVAALDPDAFASLAQAMQTHAGRSAGILPANPSAGRHSERSDRTQPLRPGEAGTSGSAVEESLFSAGETSKRDPSTPSRALAAASENHTARDSAQDDGTRVTQAQSDFFHSANAAAVQGVLDAIETQVDRLLPENISKSARNRVVGEIYRELDASLRANRPLAQQVREAFRSGSLDAEHQRAVVSLVTGRARQALPGVAKRVLAEWTSTVVAAHNDRRVRQQAAERRVDIAGSGGTGSDGSRSMAPRDIDYRRLSDSDILNL